MKEIHPADPLLSKLLPKAKPLPGVVYVPSLYAYAFECDGEKYVFNTLTKQCFKTVLPEKASAGEGFDDLIGNYFLVPEGKDECAFYESISAMMRLYTKRKEPLGYVILPTLRCNARCVYCYEEGRPQDNMSRETAEAVLRFILDNRGNKKVGLNWFGGEPLLRQDIIDFISAGLKDAGVEYSSVIVSNGSLITPAVIEKMLGLWRTRRIQISMDGAEADYIARKRYYTDADQYHTVIRNISLLSEAGITVSLRINADEENWPRVPEYLDDLTRLVAHKENVLVYFSPLMAVRAGENDLDFWKKVISAAHLIDEAGFRPLAYTEAGMRFRVTRCMADSGAMVITPDGGLYPCEHCPEGSRFGDVFNGVTDEAARREFCRTDRTREMCRNCPMLPDCTSLASCPWVDAHCREAHEMLALNTLRRMVRRVGKEDEAPDANDYMC